MKTHSFHNQLVAVFGMARSGLATARALLNSGARVIAWDDNPHSLINAQNIGISVVDFRTIQWSQVSALVLSPGVPLTGDKKHWCVKLANQFHVEVIGDIELFVRERRLASCHSPFIAVTGTNGKSTTVALIAHILNQKGCDVQLGGNIGNPVMNLKDFSSSRFYIIECSSYQIELTPTIDPSIGVLLNISADHLDRHHNLENYIAIKKKIVTQSQHAVLCLNDCFTRQIASDLAKIRHSMTLISPHKILKQDLSVERSCMQFSSTSEVIVGLSKDQEEYPVQNTDAAIAVCVKLGLTIEEIKQSLSSFNGLIHRFQKIAQLGQVIFINDSKATNIDSVRYALMKTRSMIYWIAGGISKSNDFSALFPYLSKIAKAYFIGESAEIFAHSLQERVNCEVSQTLDKAIESVVHDVYYAQVPSIVLFSPGCASFDQYIDFRERGFAFMSQVSKIKGIEMLINLDKEREFLW
ncbi:MAG: UDP-N-acetylmuramoyl-L-alanine--D-glutamate ligase [Candidatus Liberibacter ctenarytainae]|uniref:UDP-N-acetylmuramoylalanine--D-glutamate ligase n=1 Tax=Candidatus Liberibacter ctenarytainae TaxID=2020335 RepID=A0A937AS47_9HYPH|nr:UDP-N-acetylmuramoyl-L-alanine--D-glutamate ligase [Candidatus Liberibacter ctenarytainae]